MKYVWSLLLILSGIIGGLFLFQNSSRFPSIDDHGYQLSLDLFLIGFATPEINLATIIVSTFSVGIVFGLLLPLIWKSYRSS